MRSSHPTTNHAVRYETYLYNCEVDSQAIDSPWPKEALERTRKRPPATPKRPRALLRRKPKKTQRRHKQTQQNGQRDQKTVLKRTATNDRVNFDCNTNTFLSEAAAEKKAEAERKKAEKAALLAEEEASLPSKGGAKKAPVKKSKGLDLSGLDLPSSKKELSALNASGIDNAMDALALTSGKDDKIDRHPERRFKAAYNAYEEKRLEEMKDDKGLRRNQKIAEIRKEFEKHPDNPFNQVSATYDARKEDLAAIKETEKEKKERLLTGQ